MTAADQATITLRFPQGDKDVPIKKIVEFHGIKCALHRGFMWGIDNPTDWAVSEITTGMCVGRGDTLTEAIKQANERADTHPLASWQKAIKDAAKRLKKRDKALRLALSAAEKREG